MDERAIWLIGVCTLYITYVCVLVGLAFWAQGRTLRYKLVKKEKKKERKEKKRLKDLAAG